MEIAEHHGLAAPDRATQNGMRRCFLAGLPGDAIDAVLATAGPNLRKLLKLYCRAAGRFVFALRASAIQTVLALAG